MMMNLFRSKRGFTLVEILIVVIIIGILVVMGIPQLAQIRKTTWTNTCKSNISTLTNLSEAYNTERGGYPAGQAALQTGGYISKAFICPASNTSAAYTVNASGVWNCANVGTAANQHGKVSL